MDETPVFQIRLGRLAYDRLEYISNKLESDPASVFMLLGLMCLRDVTDGRHHILWYRKRLAILESEMEKESKNGQLDEDVRT